jgi:hypothetical protein
LIPTTDANFHGIETTMATVSGSPGAGDEQDEEVEVVEDDLYNVTPPREPAGPVDTIPSPEETRAPKSEDMAADEERLDEKIQSLAHGRRRSLRLAVKSPTLALSAQDKYMKRQAKHVKLELACNGCDETFDSGANLRLHSRVCLRSAPDLHNQLAKIIDCLRACENSTYGLEFLHSLTLLSESSECLPNASPETDSLLSAIFQAVNDTPPAIKDITRRFHIKIRGEMPSSEARAKLRRCLACSVMRVKQDFMVLAHTWFYEMSFALRPYWTQSVVDVINIHHQPASRYPDFGTTQQRLIITIQQMSSLAAEAAN